MAEYIDKQQAIIALTGWETEPLDGDIERTLENLPTTDIVHCKGCKYFYRYLRTNFKNCELHDLPTKEDGFCSWAERRE